MRTALFLSAISLSLAATAPQADNIAKLQSLMKHGGSGQFNCAYQGKKASKPCTVTVGNERVDHPDFVAFYGKADRVPVLSIAWPDGDVSRYCWSDSDEMLNLGVKEARGYNWASKQDEMAEDWRRGFVIEKGDKEYIRLW
jgi:hypothetical protein